MMSLKNYASLIFLSFVFFSASTWAGDELGNGGDVVVCPGKTPQLLDILERDVIYKLPPHPEENLLRIARGYKIEHAVEDVLAPLVRIAPTLHQCLTSYVQDRRFWSEILFIRDHEFHEVNDEVSYVVPRNCLKKQVAIQIPRPTASGPRYLVNHDLWNKMDSFNQASLIVHEIILRNQLMNPNWNRSTVEVRHLTAVLTSALTSELSAKQFTEVVKGHNFRCHHYAP